eukprot:3062190-Prymnesium_polylepis.1
MSCEGGLAAASPAASSTELLLDSMPEVTVPYEYGCVLARDAAAPPLVPVAPPPKPLAPAPSAKPQSAIAAGAA